MARFKLYEGPLLCNNGWVINGAWDLDGLFKGDYPPLLWEGDRLPFPDKGYNTNIYAIYDIIKGKQ